MNITAKEGITDARQLGMPKYIILGIQHLFAMFGATVLVPVLTGLSVSSTLLFAGIGTLVFHLVSKLQVPAFLGSSFAFLGGYMSVKALGVEQGMSETLALGVVLFCDGWPHQDVRTGEDPAILSPIGHWPHDYCHRIGALGQCHTELHHQLASGHRGCGDSHLCQRVGQGHHQDYPHPHGGAGQLYTGCSHR